FILEYMLGDTSNDKMGMVNQNGNTIYRKVKMNDQAASNSTHPSNITTVPSIQRYTLPTSTITLNSLGDELLRPMDACHSNEAQNIKNDLESNISVTYFPSNVLVPGSTVYTGNCV